MMRYLVFLLLLPFGLALAESENFGPADIHFSRIYEYTFKMSVVNQTRSGLHLSSDAVFKNNKIRFQPDDSVDQQSPYRQFDWSGDLGKREDDTVKLTISLDKLEGYNDSYWFDSSTLVFKEQFVPKDNITSAVNRVLDQHQMTNREQRESFLKNHIFLSSTYALSEPYNNYVEVDEEREEHYSVKNFTDDVLFTYDVLMRFENSTFFANSMTKKALDTKYVEGFYMGASYSLVKELHESLLKNNDISITYYMYSIGKILPLNVIGIDGIAGETGEAFQILPNEGTDKRGLYCKKTEIAKFECQITFQFNTTIRFPGKEDVSKYAYPKFVVDYLTKIGMTDEQMREGVSKIQLEPPE